MKKLKTQLVRTHTCVVRYNIRRDDPRLAVYAVRFVSYLQISSFVLCESRAVIKTLSIIKEEEPSNNNISD